MSEKRVFVIGGGLAGLSAAFSALDQGAHVILVEKAATLGGNSAKATSGVNAVNTQYQLNYSPPLNDSIDLFLNDILKSGKGLCDAALAHSLAALSGEAVDDLVERFELKLSDINQLGGHSAPRTHRFPAMDGRVLPVGYTMATTLRQNLEAKAQEGRATIMTSTSLVDFELGDAHDGYKAITSLTLRSEDGTEKVHKDFTGVVFSAGGYGADSTPSSLLAKVRPDLVGFPTTNGAFATGDTVRLGMEKGLRTIHLDKVQLHPTGFVHPGTPDAPQKFLCPEVIRGLGAVLLNPDGKRFIDEVSTRDTVSHAIREFGGNSSEWKWPKSASDAQKMALMIISDEIANKFGLAAFNFYKGKGFFFELKTDEDVKQYAPTLTYNAIQHELQAYDMAAKGDTKDPYGKTRFPVRFDTAKQLYGAFITPSLHFSMGGLAITTDSRAIYDITGDPIVNLFVAGENSGGVHGANRLGGNGCLESLVFGRLSGKRAGQIPPNFLSSKLTSDTSKSYILSIREGGLELAAPSPAHYWPVGDLTLKALNIQVTPHQSVTIPVHTVEQRMGAAFILSDLNEAELKEQLHPGLMVQLIHQTR